MDGVIYFVAHLKTVQSVQPFHSVQSLCSVQPRDAGENEGGVERLKRLELFEPKPNLIVPWVMGR